MALIDFQNIWILLLLLLIPILVYFYLMHLKKKQALAMKFSSLGIIKSSIGEKKFNWRKHIEFILLSLAVIMIIIGFADPHIPLEKTREGVNVVLAIDVSGSMKANDYSPSRIEAAKSSAETLVKNLKPKDNVGIVIFESGASTSSFLTPFKDKAIDKLRGISSRDGQTAIGDGLALAIDMASSIPNQKKIIILLSDGVNNAGVISPDEAIQFAIKNKIQVYSIAMGSDKQVVLGYDWFGNPQYAQLDETTLKKIADETKGKYFKSVDSGTLDKIYSTISEDIKREKEPTSIKDWFFLAALLLLISLLYINYGRFRIIR